MSNKLNELMLKAGVKLQMNKPDETAVSIGRGLAMSGIATTALLVSVDANAASLLDTGRSIFTTIYAVVGVFGAIGVVITGLNWAFGNFMGSGDPKKLFFQVLFGVAIALGAVAIIQTIKDWVAGGGDDISTL